MKPSSLNLPSLPGVYLFKNALHEIIYVGKAKELKKRVRSYFSKYGKDWKIDALLDEHASIDHIVTHTEMDALLLEAQLIRQHKPKFNVLLKNGQPFVYLLFTKEPLPKLELVRNKKQKGTYFGPFLHKKQARSVYHYLLETFRLSWCNKKIKGGCLNYHLERCVGNCMDTFDEEHYAFRVNLAINLLQGRYKKSLKQLNDKITQYSEQMAFEKARTLHEYLQNLEVIFNTLKIKFSSTKYAKDISFATTPIWRKTDPDLKIGEKLQKLLNLEYPPSTIDCFDISHFQSTSIVGSCIRFTDGVPDKNNFRRFAIKSLKKQNDYAALQEIVMRRYKHKENMPDLIFIDGGKGQLSSVQVLFPNAQCISLAKREERLYSKNKPEGVLLDVKTDVGKLLIALRDYAHHFAISYHRLKRNKEL